ncbi:MAG: hypothetical protein IPK67_19230 [Planctomycetes bacterium]|nr:hypothetical protein [Planctomycetota bacterium]
MVGFLAYAIAHEAHHRGQICMLARNSGIRCPRKSESTACGSGPGRWKDGGFE